jgi:hypothetical protein
MHVALKSKMSVYVKLQTLDYLIDSGADPKLRDGLGKSLWDWSRDMHEELQDWLEEFFGGERGCGDPNCNNCG